MGINPAIVRQFLERKLDEYDWIKEVSVDELDAEIKLLTPKPVFYQNLYKHQKACFLIGANNPKFCFFLDMGTGKTCLTLHLINYYMAKKFIKKTLVLVPNQVAIESWDEQCGIFAPNLEHMPLFGSSEKRLQLLQQEADIYTINYAGLVRLCCDYIPGEKGGKGKLWPVQHKIESFTNYFDAVVLDESHLVKNHQSLTYKVVSKAITNCKVRYALTGTPFGRDPQDFWPQFKLVDDGATLGKTLGIFREAFFSKKINYWGGYEYSLLKRREEDFQKCLKHKSIWYDEKECQDLPELVSIPVHINMPDVYQKYYQSIKKQVIELQGDKKKLKGVFIKARQVSSGFLALDDDVTGEKIKIDFGENPKLEALLGLIEDMPSTSKMVIFHEFIYSGDLIVKSLKKMKIKSSRLGTGAKDPRQEYKRFKDDPKCKVFVVNNHAGSTVLNLQNANYVVYYESPVSPIDRAQSQKRCHRSGQEKRVFMYDLIMVNSVDERIQGFLKEGKDLFDYLMTGKAEDFF